MAVLAESLGGGRGKTVKGFPPMGGERRGENSSYFVVRL